MFMAAVVAVDSSVKWSGDEEAEEEEQDTDTPECDRGMIR